MYTVRYQIAQSFIHELMSLHPVKGAELPRHDQQTEMPTAARGARMTGVLCAVVLQFHRSGRQICHACAYERIQFRAAHR